MEKAHSQRPKTVAVVGTGMAGLTTAHLLHRDPKSRYQVTLLEKQDKISLSAESIAIPSKDEKDHLIWADVPMRAFAGGFYQNLIRMYDYLGVNYHAQPFLFSFTKLPQTQQSKSSANPCVPGPKMVYASNFHQIPPVPRTMDLINWCMEAVYAVLCYSWFTLCCFFISPSAENVQTGTPGESLDHYLRRIWLPQYYVMNYLLPLISSVCTCSHQELLCFPASDILDYKRRTHRQQHFVVSSGVQSVQTKLLEGLQVRLGVDISSVTPEEDGVQINSTSANGSVSEKFDLVVLAVSPDAAAALFPSLNAQLSTIPTTTVETVAHTDESSITPTLRATTTSTSLKDIGSGQTQRIHFYSNGSITEAVHEQPHSIFVTTNPLLPMKESKVIRSARFTRVLRSPRSRLTINSIFQNRNELPRSPSAWRNGDGGIFLAGGWCWDGMVLLEGCIVSAMRVAAQLDVVVPWLETEN